ncbi:MAG: PaaI family thioesterase [Myxococcales bacterium]|nr:PaaI family thioesterase [Myxococcales bacterium]
MTSPRTHLAIDSALVGTPVELGSGRAVVALVATAPMAADARGLIHGGFIFGLADYAAMLAVNDPNVVLASAEVRFVAPVVVGETVTATAESDPPAGRKRKVRVVCASAGARVFEGTFGCVVLDEHVLGAAS